MSRVNIIPWFAANWNYRKKHFLEPEGHRTADSTPQRRNEAGWRMQTLVIVAVLQRKVDSHWTTTETGGEASLIKENFPLY